MKLRPDPRRLANDAEKNGVCRRCGCRLILLPNDKRNGYCFQCYDTFLTENSDFEGLT